MPKAELEMCAACRDNYKAACVFLSHESMFDMVEWENVIICKATVWIIVFFFCLWLKCNDFISFELHYLLYSDTFATLLSQTLPHFAFFIFNILSYYTLARSTTSSIAYWTTLCQLVDSKPGTVTCVYAAELCHKSINWVMSFPQALEPEILSHDVVKTVAASLCVKSIWRTHSLCSQSTVMGLPSERW